MRTTVKIVYIDMQLFHNARPDFLFILCLLLRATFQTMRSLILGRNSDLLDFFVLSFAEKRVCEWVFAPDRITFPPLKDLEA